MAIVNTKHKKRSIDIDGPAGNAFALMGQAQSFAKQCGWPKNKTSEMLEDMQSGDYEHLIHVFDKHWGEICDLRSEVYGR